MLVDRQVSDVIALTDLAVMDSPTFIVGAVSPFTLEVAFSTPMIEGAALLSPASYLVQQVTGSVTIPVSSVSLSSATPTRVTLILNGLLDSKEFYFLTVESSVLNQEGFDLVPNVRKFQWADMTRPLNGDPLVIPIENFSGELSEGQVFFSPAYETVTSDSTIQLEEVSVCTLAYDQYKLPDPPDPPPLFTYPGPNSSIGLGTILWAPADRIGLVNYNLHNFFADFFENGYDGPATGTLREPIDITAGGFLNNPAWVSTGALSEMSVSGTSVTLGETVSVLDTFVVERITPSFTATLNGVVSSTFVLADNFSFIGPGQTIVIQLQGAEAVLADTIAIVDSVLTEPEVALIFSETLVITDDVAAETFRISSQIQIGLSLDTLVVADTFGLEVFSNNTINVLLADEASITDSEFTERYRVGFSFTFPPINDTLAVSDDVSTLTYTWNQTLLDVAPELISVSDTTGLEVLGNGLVSVFLADTVEVSEDLFSQRLRAGVLVSGLPSEDNLVISDEIQTERRTSTQAIEALGVDTISLTDQVVAERVIVVSDNIAILDTVAKAIAIAKTVSDTLAISDSVTVAVQSVPGETTVWLEDFLVLTDDVSVQTQTQNTYNLVLGENLVVDEFLSVVLLGNHLFSVGVDEIAITVTDAVQTNLQKAILVSDTVVIADTAASETFRDTNEYIAILGDSLAVTDTVGVELFANATTITIQFSETLVVTDQVLSERFRTGVERSVTPSADNISLVDEVTTVLIASGTISLGLPLDSIVITDNVGVESSATGTTYEIQLADTISLTEQQFSEEFTFGVVRVGLPSEDNLQLSDEIVVTALTSGGLLVGLSVDSIVLTDNLGIERFANGLVSVDLADQIGIEESLFSERFTGTTPVIVSASDNLQVSDEVVVTALISGGLLVGLSVDSLVLTDSLGIERFANGLVSIDLADQIGIEESIFGERFTGAPFISVLAPDDVVSITDESSILLDSERRTLVELPIEAITITDSFGIERFANGLVSIDLADQIGIEDSLVSEEFGSFISVLAPDDTIEITDESSILLDSERRTLVEIPIDEIAITDSFGIERFSAGRVFVDVADEVTITDSPFTEVFETVPGVIITVVTSDDAIAIVDETESQVATPDTFLVGLPLDPVVITDELGVESSTTGSTSLVDLGVDTIEISDDTLAESFGEIVVIGVVIAEPIGLEIVDGVETLLNATQLILPAETIEITDELGIELFTVRPIISLSLEDSIVITDSLIITHEETPLLGGMLNNPDWLLVGTDNNSSSPGGGQIEITETVSIFEQTVMDSDTAQLVHPIAMWILDNSPYPVITDPQSQSSLNRAELWGYSLEAINTPEYTDPPTRFIRLPQGAGRGHGFSVLPSGHIIVSTSEDVYSNNGRESWFLVPPDAEGDLTQAECPRIRCEQLFAGTAGQNHGARQVLTWRDGLIIVGSAGIWKPITLAAWGMSDAELASLPGWYYNGNGSVSGIGNFDCALRPGTNQLVIQGQDRFWALNLDLPMNNLLTTTHDGTTVPGGDGLDWIALGSNIGRPENEGWAGFIAFDAAGGIWKQRGYIPDLAYWSAATIATLPKLGGTSQANPPPDKTLTCPIFDAFDIDNVESVFVGIDMDSDGGLWVTSNNYAGFINGDDIYGPSKAYHFSAAAVAAGGSQMPDRIIHLPVESQPFSIRMSPPYRMHVR